MVLSFIYPDPICGEPDNRPWAVANVHYMYFAMFSFFSTALVMCLVSLISRPPTEEQVRGLTFWTRNDGLAPTADSVDTTSDGDGVLPEVRFSTKTSINDADEENDNEKNGLPAEKFIVVEIGKLNQYLNGFSLSWLSVQKMEVTC